MEGNPHSNHRARVRKLFRESGIKGLSDHNVLELLLFYSIPRKDTNITAHNLINEFGSLKGVLNASVEALSQVDGVGEYTATFLSLINQTAKRCLEEEKDSAFMCNDAEKVSDYAKKCFMADTSESIVFLMFGADAKFVSATKLVGSSVADISVNKRAILQAALKYNAVFMIMAHNHPGGVAAPSAEDITATRVVANLLSEIGSRLCDHVIVSGNDAFSLRRNVKFASLFI